MNLLNSEYSNAVSHARILKRYVKLNIQQTPQNEWYAIRLASGAFQPAKRYWVEKGPEGGRYLRYEDLKRTVIVNSLDHLDIDYYIPMIGEAYIHHRTKKPKTRFKPMIPGYGFVRGAIDQDQIEGAKGVHSIMRHGHGYPALVVPETDIMRVQLSEKALDREFKADLKNMRLKRINNWRRGKLSKYRVTKNQAEEQYPAGALFKVKSGHYLEGYTGRIEGHTGRNTIRSIAQLLGGDIPAEFKLDQIELIG